MAQKATSTLVLAAIIGLLACSTPSTSSRGTTQSFEISQESPFQWGIKKDDIKSSIDPNNFDKVWNVKRTKNTFARFGEVEYRLFFDFDDNALTSIQVVIFKSKDVLQVTDKLYDLYEFMLSKNISFISNNHRINKNDFAKIIQKRSRTLDGSKNVYLPLSSIYPMNQFMIYIDDSDEAIEKQYAAILQISRS
jgi:hypothetical protein